MSHPILSHQQVMVSEKQSVTEPIRVQQEFTQVSSPDLATSMTRKASFQTYFTIRYLVDTTMVADAYRAYAYFRWVDDTLDQGQLTEAERLAFLARQQRIIARCYQEEPLDGLIPRKI